MRPTEIFSHWEIVRADLHALIERFREEELALPLYPGGWPVGQVMLHIAECEDYWLHTLVSQAMPHPVRYAFDAYPTRAAIQTALSGAHERTLELLSGLDEHDLARQYRIPGNEVYSLYWIIWHVIEHEIHHRGELSLFLGQVGREGLDV